MTTAVEARAIEKKASPSTELSPPPTRPLILNRVKPGGSAPAVKARPRANREASECHLATTGPVPTWKRVLDVTCILISLPLTLPCMAVVALWIKFVSRGPVLFLQERVGRNGKHFTLYKFRSMKLNADTERHQNHFRHLVRSDSPMVKLDLLCDSRLITAGCFMRAAGLDELPQLFNVLRGEMSLVGPRPCLPEEYRFFTPRQRERFEVLPGLTGIWQVVGKGVATFSEMNAMDLLYVRRASASLDLSIMMRTPVALFRQLIQGFKNNHTASENPIYAPSQETMLSGSITQRLS